MIYNKPIDETMTRIDHSLDDFACACLEKDMPRIFAASMQVSSQMAKLAADCIDFKDTPT
jgi:hypothetical protein